MKRINRQGRLRIIKDNRINQNQGSIIFKQAIDVIQVTDSAGGINC